MISPSKKTAWKFAIPLFAIAFAWAAMMTVDWSMRFSWFHWERTFVSSRARPAYMGETAPLSVQVAEDRRGGDLANMLGARAEAEGLALDHVGGYALYADEFGLPNIPPTTGVYHRIALVGDSFMMQGRGTSNFLGGRLARLLGEPVYTLAHAGRGPAYPFSTALLHPYLREKAPQVLVWGVPERDATGYIFTSTEYQTLRQLKALESPATDHGARIVWRQLLPAELDKSLPNTSFIAQLMRKGWSKIRPALGTSRATDVYVSSNTFDGFHMLFYRVNIQSLFWSPEIRNVAAAQRAANSIQEKVLAPRGIKWVIVLIPEKEQVYREYVPMDAYPGNQPWPPSVFDALEPALAAEGIAVVNLLPIFRAAAARGELIYWPDDTHWNEAGVQLAAETIVHAIESEPTRHEKKHP